jgi:hypothetical protein
MRILQTLLLCLFFSSLWAADVTGKWNVTAKDPEGQVIRSQMTLRSESGKLTGEVTAGDRKIPLTEAKLEGDTLTVKLMWGDIPLTIRTTVTGDAMKGSYSTDSGDTGPIEAQREAAAAAAGVAGKWKLTAKSQSGNEIKADLEIQENAGKWSGTLITGDGIALPLSEVQLTDGRLSFRIQTDNGAFALEFTASGASMQGTVKTPDGATMAVAAAR